MENLWLLAVAGLGAGAANGVVGGGTLVSFPTLVAAGYPALTANVTSSVGIWSGYLGGSMGFRGEIGAQKGRLKTLSAPVVAGAVVGVALLVSVPSGIFRSVVPYLLLGACLLFAVQPVIARRMGPEVGSSRPGTAVRVGVFACSVYGAYFGAGAGVVMLALFGLGFREPLVKLNALRTVVVFVVNSVAAVLYAVVAPVAWQSVVPMFGGALAGGYVGARLAKVVPEGAVRALVIGAGVLSAWRLLAR